MSPEPEQPGREDVEIAVESEDLSREANAALTEDVREALGTDHVEAPPERAERAAHPRVPHGRSTWANLSSAKPAIAVTAAVVVIAAIVGLLLKSWVAVAVCVAVLAIVLLAVVVTVARSTEQVERPSDRTTALLEEEGVRDPEKFFNQEVQAWEGGRSASANERTVRPGEDPGEATEEQRRAWTPSSEAVEPAENAAEPPTLIPVFIFVSLLVAIVIIAAIEGGAMWLLVPIAGIPTLLALGWTLRNYLRDDRR